MLKITCTGCQKTLPVAEEHVGKWIRCRGCGTAVQVVGDGPTPAPAPAVGRASAKARGKAANDASAVRRMDAREFKKKRKGDSLLGASGLDLGGSAAGGSAMGGSSAGASGSFAGMSGSFAGMDLSGPATADSQSQLWEIKELNRQRAEGSISKEAYKQRKAEIMSGRSLAVQAMSRSADGMGPSAKKPTGRAMPVLPGPIKALIAVAVLAVGGFVLWETVLKADPDATTLPGQLSTGGDGAGADGVRQAGVLTPDVSVVDPSAVDGGGSGASAAAVGEAVAGQTGDAAVAAAGAMTPPVAETVEVPAVRLITIDDPTDAMAMPIPGVPVPPVVAQAVGWDVPWPDYPADSTTAIGQACPIVKQMAVGDETAFIGVAGGPEATGLDDPAYAAYQASMHQVLTNVAVTDGVYDGLVIKTSDRPKRMGTLVVDRYYVEHRLRRGVLAMILTGVQDGYCVSYWFAGSSRIVPKFFDLVGSAKLQPMPGG